MLGGDQMSKALKYEEDDITWLNRLSRARELIRASLDISDKPAYPMIRPSEYDRERAWHIAAWYEAQPVMPANSLRPMSEIYTAFGEQVALQYRILKAVGFTFHHTTEDPYRTSAEMLNDLLRLGCIRVYKTDPKTPHPFISNEANDQFRAVHDALGHGLNGNTFGPVGEENAFREHASMFTSFAIPALATETCGQNSWFNAGPFSHLPVTERPFAVQKAALFPAKFLPSLLKDA